METRLLPVALAAALGFALTVIIGKFVLNELRALRAGQEIRADGPTWHGSKAGTPTMGGIMFILGSGVTVLAIAMPYLAAGSFVPFYVFFFALAFGAIGFLDDFQKVRLHQNEGLTARQKFLLQLAFAVLFLSVMRYGGHLSNTLYIPVLNIALKINWYLYLIFAAFVIVGCVNAVNITDGVDGLAGSVTWIVMIFFALAGVLVNRFFVHALFPAALSGGLLAFLIYNHHPAKIFMGDTGSLFLGGAVAALAFALDMPLILIPIGIIYICETMSDIIQITWFKYTRRKTGTGKRIFKMAPLHHHLELCGWSENKLCVVFSLITAFGCILAWLAIMARYGA